MRGAKFLSSVYPPKHFQRKSSPANPLSYTESSIIESYSCYNLTELTRRTWGEAVFTDLINDDNKSQMKNLGQGSSPLPRVAFVIANEPGKGKMQFVQKVFEGPFEVSGQLVKPRKDGTKQ